MRDYCDFVEKNERILVISQPNAGAGAARNKGMEAASGEYLAFIDADDFWKPGLLEDAYRWMKQCSADLCLYPFAVYDEQTGTVSATETKVYSSPNNSPSSLTKTRRSTSGSTTTPKSQPCSLT